MAAGYPDGDGHVEPYASENFREPSGGQSLKAGGYPEPTCGDGYGTAAGDFDNSIPRSGPRGDANDHTRATAAGKPPAKGSKDTSKDPFDVAVGTDGQSPWKRPDPVHRRPGSTTQRP